MDKEGMQMRLSRTIVATISIAATFILTGCSEKLIELTPSEQNEIVSYSAHTVTLYNIHQEKGYIQLSEDYLKTIKETKSGEFTTTPTTTPTPTPTQEGSNDGQTETAVTNATQAMGITDLDVSYLGMELLNEFLGGQGAYDVSPESGKKLLVLKFQLSNLSKENLSVNIPKQIEKFAVRINDTKTVSSMITILPTDMGTLETTLEVGGKQETYLFFQVSQQTQDEINAIEFIVKRGAKDYKVKVK